MGMKNHNRQIYKIIKIQKRKTLEQDTKLSVKENNNNFDNIANLLEKLETFIPELKVSL